MNQKIFNENTTGTQAPYAPESIMQQNKGLSYKFEIMEDENIYSISFDAKLRQERTKKMLEAIQNCLYEKIADSIQLYLKQHNIVYSGFVSSKAPLNHNKTMELAELLLHSNDYSDFDNYFGNADICYLVADHQKWISEDCCQGCYFAVKKTLTESESLCKYNIIGQTFCCNETNCDENGCFTIRENRDSEELYSVVTSSGETILPAFGCVDMMGLLSNIDSIQTIEQAKKIAIK